MKKEYTRINGIRIAYKGDILPHDRKWILKELKKGIVSDTLSKGGWWIKAKHSISC